MSRRILPESGAWPRAALADLGALTDGDWILAADYAPDGVRLLQVGDVGRGVFVGKSKRFITMKRARALGCTFLQAGDILISRMPDPIGRACVLPDLGYPAITAVDVSIWRPSPNLIDPSFVVSYLNSDEWLNEVRRHASGATRQRISRTKLQALRVPVPPLAIQRTLAERTGSAMQLVSSASSAVAEQLELAHVLASSTLREPFLGVSPVVAGPPRSPAPRGWFWHQLTMVARLESGHTPSRRHPEWWGGDIPWIALPDIRALDGRVAFQTSETVNDQGIANSSARVLPTHTVVMSRTASVGFVTIMGRPMATSQDFVNWVCGPELDPFFLAYALRASRGYIRGLASGAVHKTIYMPALESLRVCAPPIDEQRRIAGELDRRLGEVESLARGVEGRLNLISTLPAAILRSAFSEQESLELRRGAVASYLVERLHDQPTFGRVMFQKLLYLAEAHLGVDLGGEYERRAAGPHAPRALRDVEALAEENGWFSTRKEDGRYVYTPGPNISERVAAAQALLGEGKAELDRLIDLFGHRRTEIAEVVATLFAAWNDFLLDGQTPTDEEIVAELHTNWHERKRTFSADRLGQALDWMREKNIVPVGRGPRTEMVNA